MPNSQMPATYGPRITNKDYEFIIVGDSYFDPFIYLDGHSIGSPDIDQTDPVTIPITTRERGRLIQRFEYVKPSLIRTRSYEIGIPRGAFWSPLLKIAAIYSKNCRRDAFTRYLCPEAPCYQHAFRYPTALFDSIAETETVLATEDDEVGITQTVQMHTSRRMIYYYLRTHETYDDQTTPPIVINSVKFNIGGCLDCGSGASSNPHLRGWVVGDDAGAPAVPVIWYSEDRFSFRVGTFDDLSANIPAASVSTTIADLYVDGDFVIFIGTAGANSEILVTNDNGATIALATTVTGAVLNVVDKGANGWYFAAGTAGAVYRSRNGFNWEVFTLPSALAAAIINDIDADHDTGYTYMVGSLAGNYFVMRVEDAGASNISTASYGASPAANPARGVAVLAPDHVIVVANNGIARETVNATSDSSWTAVNVGGETDDLIAVDGDPYSTLIVTGEAATPGTVYWRSILYDNVFKTTEFAPGGAVALPFVGLDAGLNDLGMNDFVMATDNEVFVMKACTPDA